MCTYWDFNGRLTQQEPGAGPIIMNLMCGKGWLPFLHTAPRGTNLYPIRTFWRSTGRRTCPDHAFINSTSEQILTPSGAYVLDGLTELSDGHHILGVAFQVADGPIPVTMQIPKQHHTHKRKAPMRPKTPRTWKDIKHSSCTGFAKHLLWTMNDLLEKRLSKLYRPL